MKASLPDTIRRIRSAFASATYYFQLKAPCTAVVFVWSNLSDGEPHFMLSQVALNDIIMVLAFAPIVGLLPGLSAITLLWETLLLSVVLYIVVPVVIAQIVRRSVIANGGSEASYR